MLSRLKMGTAIIAALVAMAASSASAADVHFTYGEYSAKTKPFWLALFFRGLSLISPVIRKKPSCLSIGARDFALRVRPLVLPSAMAILTMGPSTNI